MPADDREDGRRSPRREDGGAEQGTAPRQQTAREPAGSKSGKRPGEEGTPRLTPQQRNTSQQRKEMSRHGSRALAGRPSPPSRGVSSLRPRGILLSIPVWDLPLRLFHWLLVLDVAAAYAARLAHELWDVPMRLHYRLGLFALSLVLFRWLWGFWGSETARFSRFLRPPREAVDHLKALFRREPDTAVGHNPAGGYMVMLLLVLLTLQTVSGLFARSDATSAGPYNLWLTEAQSKALSTFHSVNFVLLAVAVGLHVAAILFYRLIKGQNLLTPLRRALFLYALSAAAVAALAWAAPGAGGL